MLFVEVLRFSNGEYHRQSLRIVEDIHTFIQKHVMHSDLPGDIFNEHGRIWRVELDRKSEGPRTNCGHTTSKVVLQRTVCSFKCCMCVDLLDSVCVSFALTPNLLLNLFGGIQPILIKKERKKETIPFAKSTSAKSSIFTFLWAPLRTVTLWLFIPFKIYSLVESQIHSWWKKMDEGFYKHWKHQYTI